MNIIPPITDPRGKLWKQPDRSEIAIDDEVAMMTQQTHDKLLDYTASMPTGKYAGKMYRQRYRDQNGVEVSYLRWFENDQENHDMLLVPSRRIIIID